MVEDEIHFGAIEFAKRNKNRIAKELTDPTVFKPVGLPVSIFMAGSPGAGKTEFSRSFIAWHEEKTKQRIIRIDGDDIRGRMPGYDGKNSYLFQGAVAVVVEKIHDYALHQGQSFVLDGTFSKYEKAAENIRRSHAKGRPIFIFYLFQDPKVAWRFTQAREDIEGRNIPRSAFVQQFLGSKETVEHILKNFGDQVSVYLVKKDFIRNTVENIVKLGSGRKNIDDYIKWEYVKKALHEL